MIDPKKTFAPHEYLEARERGLKTNEPALGVSTLYEIFIYGRVWSAADLAKTPDGGIMSAQPSLATVGITSIANAASASNPRIPRFVMSGARAIAPKITSAGALNSVSSE
jgi:hypothetical protein